jgi:hypothetical protein
MWVANRSWSGSTKWDVYAVEFWMSGSHSDQIVDAHLIPVCRQSAAPTTAIQSMRTMQNRRQKPAGKVEVTDAGAGTEGTQLHSLAPARLTMLTPVRIALRASKRHESISALPSRLNSPVGSPSALRLCHQQTLGASPLRYGSDGSAPSLPAAQLPNLPKYTHGVGENCSCTVRPSRETLLRCYHN